MALFFQNIQNAPQTHVFIIGVGGYSYLKGGDKAKEQSFDGAKLLGQLTSPPVSAEAFYKTVIDLDQQNCWIKPLGSIEILISPAPLGAQVFAGQSLEPATMVNIKNSYWEWKKRCDSNPDNVALFFFCGHGLDKGEHYLLAEDFGINPLYPWDGCFAFDLTRRAFFSCNARTQIFLVDSCRQLTPDMLRTVIPSTPIEAPDLLSRDCEFNLTQKASAMNEGAYGKKNQPSYYTKALLGALKGNAASNENGEWNVSTGTLSAKMNAFMLSEVAAESNPQRCISTTSNVTDLIRFNEPPMVPLSISCNPTQALALADLSCLDPVTNKGLTRTPAPQSWEINVAAGIYKVEASFMGKEYKNAVQYKPVMPPFSKEKLNCL